MGKRLYSDTGHPSQLLSMAGSSQLPTQSSALIMKELVESSLDSLALNFETSCKCFYYKCFFMFLYLLLLLFSAKLINYCDQL